VHTLPDGLTRIELIHLRQNHQYRLSLTRSRLLHWQALVRAAAALSADFATEDQKISKFMRDVVVSAVQQERACVVEIDSLSNQMDCISDILRGGDALISLIDLKAETDEIAGKS